MEPEDVILGRTAGEGIEEALDMADEDEVEEAVAEAVVDVEFVAPSETTK
jgi:hypothetical protein